MNESEYIKKHYKTSSNKEIGRVLNLSARQVWSRAKKLGLVNPHNPTFSLNRIQEQIILSGIIGDGGIRKNGKNGFLCRECHAVDEQDYLAWKFHSLHPLTKTTNITDIPSRGKNQLPQKYFNTTTTRSLKRFFDMDRADIIGELDELGLALLILDDGWARKYSKTTISMHLSIISLNEVEKNDLLNAYKRELGVNAWITNKGKNIAFGVDSTAIIYDTLTKYMDENMDVLKKKFFIYY